jgi:hypothetical protein
MVKLWGKVDSEAEREAARVTADRSLVSERSRTTCSYSQRQWSMRPQFVRSVSAAALSQLQLPSIGFSFTFPVLRPPP